MERKQKQNNNKKKKTKTNRQGYGQNGTGAETKLPLSLLPLPSPDELQVLRSMEKPWAPSQQTTNPPPSQKFALISLPLYNQAIY